MFFFLFLFLDSKVDKTVAVVYFDVNLVETPE